jgi:MYXO-CTERM domain-containing protein
MADCSMIESSIAFAFVDAMPDTRTICEVMAQEVAHSYGVDHELLPTDPMSYLFYDGERTFQNISAPCGEHEPRQCGGFGAACRPEQNSFAVLTERLGANPHPDDPDNPTNAELSGSCSSTRGGGALAGLLVALAALRRRRS